jgi:hypothetical protein
MHTDRPTQKTAIREGTELINIYSDDLDHAWHDLISLLLQAPKYIPHEAAAEVIGLPVVVFPTALNAPAPNGGTMDYYPSVCAGDRG